MSTNTRRLRRAVRRGYLDAWNEQLAHPAKRRRHFVRVVHFSRISLESLSCAVVSIETRFLLLAYAMWAWIILDIVLLITGEYHHED